MSLSCPWWLFTLSSQVHPSRIFLHTALYIYYFLQTIPVGIYIRKKGTLVNWTDVQIKNTHGLCSQCFCLYFSWYEYWWKWLKYVSIQTLWTINNFVFQFYFRGYLWETEGLRFQKKEKYQRHVWLYHQQILLAMMQNSLWYSNLI